MQYAIKGGNRNRYSLSGKIIKEVPGKLIFLPAHEYMRHGGSIGTTSTPGRVMKNRKMAGQCGNERVTVQNLKVFSVDAEQNLILVKGSIPGANGSVVCVQDAAKSRHSL